MAGQQSTGKLYQKLGKQLAPFHETAKKQEIKAVGGGNNLPPDMSGIAIIKQLRFIEIKAEGPNKGKLMFFGSASVVEPETFIDKMGNKHFPRGQFTTVNQKLYDTPGKTVQDHWNWVVQLLGRIGVPVAEISFENVEEVCNQIAKSGVAIRFRTWQGKPTPEYPNPQIQHVWEGQINYEVPDVAAHMTQDDTAHPDPEEMVGESGNGGEVSGVEDSTETVTEGTVPVEDAPKSTRFGPAVAKKVAEATKTPAKTQPAKSPPKPPTKAKVAAPAPDPEPTLEEMAEQAEGNDNYGAKLTEAANAVGITDEEISNMEGGWVAVVEEIRRRESGEGETSEVVEEVQEEDNTPKVGDVKLFKPKGSTKAVQGQIEAVEDGKVVIKNLIDNKKYRVPFDALTPLPE